MALWNTDLSRPGPGLLLQDILDGDDPQIVAVVQVIAALDADILLLTGIDHDLRGQALTALADALAAAGAPYPHRIALRPNTGVATGLDLDGNGSLGQARDAQGFGRFAGEGGMALLSRHPINRAEVRDYSRFLWADLPGNLIPPDTPPDIRAVQRLSTTGHWAVPVTLPGGGHLTILAYYASPPVFDGEEDRNGRRNHDETAFWLRLLAGELPMPPPAGDFILMGQTNLDPADGEGRRQAVQALLASPLLQDPAPRGTAGRRDRGQKGDPALDTALYQGLGGLRVEVVLPSSGLLVTGSGVLWPPGDDPLSPALTTASRHYPVWVRVAAPAPAAQPPPLPP